jgi:microcystin-dependent protein
LWYGSIGSVPAGGYLCDGSNGTPDLRNRFVVGAGATYSVAQTGGSADSIVVSHTHTATTAITDPGHNHVVTGFYNYGTAGVAPGGNGFLAAGSPAVSVSTATTGVTAATTVASAGTSGTNANLPPYYALAYVMKA